MGTGYFLFNAQDPKAAPGDIAGENWVRYSDKATKAFKLNAERNNGRAAMLGITGCLIHELLGVDALYPTGGMDGAAPEPLINSLNSFSAFPSFAETPNARRGTAMRELRHGRG